MSEAVVQLKIAGQSYRVVTTATEDDLKGLAHRVEDALRSVTTPGRQPSEQAMVLAAITLANDLEQERRARRELEARYETQLRELLALVDGALGETPVVDSVEREFARIAPTLAPPPESETLELPFMAGARALGEIQASHEVYVSRRGWELEAVGSEG